MPCDSIVLNNVEVGKMNPALLKKALEAIGAVGIYQSGATTWFYVDGDRYVIANGKLQCPAGQEAIADKVKQAYSAEVVKYTAKRNGWTLTKKAQFVYEVTK